MSENNNNDKKEWEILLEETEKNEEMSESEKMNEKMTKAADRKTADDTTADSKAAGSKEKDDKTSDHKTDEASDGKTDEENGNPIQSLKEKFLLWKKQRFDEKKSIDKENRGKNIDAEKDNDKEVKQEETAAEGDRKESEAAAEGDRKESEAAAKGAQKKSEGDRKAETDRKAEAGNKPARKKFSELTEDEKEKLREERRIARENETPEEREARIRRAKSRREARKRHRRRAYMLRAVLAVAAVCLVIALGFAIRALVGKINDYRVERTKTAQTENVEEEETLVAVDLNDVVHLSFNALIADTDLAFGQEDTNAAAGLDQSHLTVVEFEAILQQLYDEGYVLVNLQDLAVMDGDTMTAQELLLPEGKKPLVISQLNVNYDLFESGQGMASKLVVSDDGTIDAELVQSDGTVVTGDYDIVPCVDAFIEEHPDFSYNNARGILGLTGYNGILGYRTDESLGSVEDNVYASQFGAFDVAAEQTEASAVIDALEQEGWQFACNGYSGEAYDGDAEEMEADFKLWKDNVGSLVGDTEILLFPEGNDIRTHGVYTEDDEAYRYLKSQGIVYFSALDLSGNWSQCTESYYRLNYRNLDGYRMYQDLYGGSERFADILDFTGIYDSARPTAPETDDTTEEAADGTTDGTTDAATDDTTADSM